MDSIKITFLENYIHLSPIAGWPRSWWSLMETLKTKKTEPNWACLCFFENLELNLQIPSSNIGANWYNENGFPGPLQYSMRDTPKKGLLQESLPMGSKDEYITLLLICYRQNLFDGMASVKGLPLRWRLSRWWSISTSKPLFPPSFRLPWIPHARKYSSRDPQRARGCGLPIWGV